MTASLENRIERKSPWIEKLRNLNEKNPGLCTLYLYASLVSAAVAGKYIIEAVQYLDKIVKN